MTSDRMAIILGVITIAVFAALIVVAMWLSEAAETDRLWRCISQGRQYVNGACL